MQNIINHPEYPWIWHGISDNPNLTIEFINSNSYKDWYWNGVSKNPGITMQDIINHPHYPWDWCWVSYNPNLTMNMIKQYPDKKWFWYHVSTNPGITMQDIINHPEYPWNWYAIAQNRNLTINMVTTYVDRMHTRIVDTSISLELDVYDCNWNWSDVSSNPGITMQDIMKHPEYPWDWSQVFHNQFSLDKQLYVNNHLGRLLLVSMLEDNTLNDTDQILSGSLLLFSNDYQLSCILPYF